MMPNTNASFTPANRGTQIKQQLDQLERMGHGEKTDSGFDRFDRETEEMLAKLYGPSHKYVESYKYASVGEAEAMVNLPESAQEPMARDVPKLAIQQRRQVLLGILSELGDLEGKEESALAGEDHEDPPMG